MGGGITALRPSLDTEESCFVKQLGGDRKTPFTAMQIGMDVLMVRRLVAYCGFYQPLMLRCALRPHIATCGSGCYTKQWAALVDKRSQLDQDSVLRLKFARHHSLDQCGETYSCTGMHKK